MRRRGYPAPIVIEPPLQLVTVREAADRLGTSEWTVRRYVARGLLPCVQFEKRGKLAIFVGDLEQFIATHVRKGPNGVRKRSVLARSKWLDQMEVRL